MVPVTTPARTLVDEAGCLDMHELEAAVAIGRGVPLDDAAIESLAAVDNVTRRGRGVAALADIHPAVGTWGHIDAVASGARNRIRMLQGKPGRLSRAGT